MKESLMALQKKFILNIDKSLPLFNVAYCKIMLLYYFTHNVYVASLSFLFLEKVCDCHDHHLTADDDAIKVSKCSLMMIAQVLALR